jgi:hypothetical protein
MECGTRLEVGRTGQEMGSVNTQTDFSDMYVYNPYVGSENKL